MDRHVGVFVETLRPRAGKRILDVGCGTGIAEVSLSRMRLSQVELFGVDLILDRVRAASEATRGINAQVSYAAADASSLPFGSGLFDSTYCVAVLQHIRDVGGAVSELARVTRVGGRLLIVEPDNAARYWFSSLASGMEAFAMGQRFFTALALARGESPAAQTGPLVPGLLRAHGAGGIRAALPGTTVSHLGRLKSGCSRRGGRRSPAAMAKAPTSPCAASSDYLKAIDQYARDAALAGTSFVEIQNTMLFATVGQRAEA